MTKKEEQALVIFERKIFRGIYGPKYENGEWKSRTNRELEEMNVEENIVKWIKGQRISWLGHLERMEEDRMARKIFTQELEGTRRRRRPRKGWKEEVEKDLQVPGVRRWREIKKNGRILFDRPKPTAGCSANGRRRRRRRRIYICVYICTLVGCMKTNKLKMLENRMQRKIFGPKRDEVTGDWRNFHSETRNDFEPSPNIIRVIP
jgi:hypothetical protein